MTQSAWHVKLTITRENAGHKGQKGSCVLLGERAAQPAGARRGWTAQKRALRAPSWSGKPLATNLQEKVAHVGYFCKSEVVVLSCKYYSPRCDYVLVPQDTFVRKIIDNYLIIHNQWGLCNNKSLPKKPFLMSGFIKSAGRTAGRPCSGRFLAPNRTTAAGFPLPHSRSQGILCGHHTTWERIWTYYH